MVYRNNILNGFYVQAEVTTRASAVNAKMCHNQATII